MANTQRPTTNDRLTRIAYLDCFSGISGDMFLGALIDAGVPPQLFQQTVKALNIGAQLEISRVTRSGISATKVEMIVAGEKDAPRDSGVQSNLGTPSKLRLGGGVQPHSDKHSHSHEHAGDRAHAHDHRHQHGRSLTDIRGIIRKADLSESTKRTALAIFEKLGAAEAKIHSIPVEDVHFHEVGAVDALVDIICAAVGAEALGVDELVCSPLNVGSGTVECAHGNFPVPAPATVELLEGAPVYSSGRQAELVTPTGAAIVATLAKRFSPFPEMTIEKSGYGAGTRDFPAHPNVLRITIGEVVQERQANEGGLTALTSTETVTILEANLDDLNPQVFGYVMDRLLESGALDVFGMPVQMKKNRQGTLLTVLSRPENADRLAEIIFAETTTLGIRRRAEKRQVLARKWQTVPTRFGDIRMKIASLNGSVSSYAPEYEDCRRIAAEHRVPLKTVMQEAVQAYLQSSKKEH